MLFRVFLTSSLIFGLVFNEMFKESVQLTVIATGIQTAGAQKMKEIISSVPPAELVEDEFEIPAFIRRRGIKEGQ